MKWSGKVFGGVLGAFVGGPIGAALGALAGHAYDEKGGGSVAGGARRRDQTTSAQIADRFFRSTFEVMGHVAKADGRVSEREIDAARAIMREFRLNQTQIDAAIDCYSSGKRADFELRESMAGLIAACTNRPDLLRIFLEIQLRAALLGADLQGPSRPLLQRIAAALGVDGLEFAHLEAVLRLRQGSARTRTADAAAEAGRLAEAYEVLEVAAGASDEEVAKAYRRQLSRHHPDKLKANGLPESMLEHAKQRTQQIIEAWELIRARRGFK